MEKLSVIFRKWRYACPHRRKRFYEKDSFLMFYISDNLIASDSMRKKEQLANMLIVSLRLPQADGLAFYYIRSCFYASH